MVLPFADIAIAFDPPFVPPGKEPKVVQVVPLFVE
jgi:hypothetical protein